MTTLTMSETMLLWRSTFGQAGPGLAADGNGNGVVDAADYVVWRTNLAATPGDYNHNGIVDSADYIVWRSSLGSTTDLAADGDGSGVIDSGDYQVWCANFGAIGGVGASASTLAQNSEAAIPEPSVMALLGFALAVSSLYLRTDERCRDTFGRP